MQITKPIILSVSLKGISWNGKKWMMIFMRWLQWKLWTINRGRRVMPFSADKSRAINEIFN